MHTSHLYILIALAGLIFNSCEKDSEEPKKWLLTAELSPNGTSFGYDEARKLISMNERPDQNARLSYTFFYDQNGRLQHESFYVNEPGNNGIYIYYYSTQPGADSCEFEYG